MSNRDPDYTLYVAVRPEDIKKMEDLFGGFGRDAQRAGMADVKRGYRATPEVQEQIKEHTKLFGRMSGFLKDIGRSTASLIGIGAGIGTLVALVTQASPLLQNMFKIMQFSVMLILRPIGDFIAMLLRPIMIMFLRNVVIPYYQTFHPIALAIGRSGGEDIANFFKDPAKKFQEGIEAAEGAISIPGFPKPPVIPGVTAPAYVDPLEQIKASFRGFGEFLDQFIPKFPEAFGKVEKSFEDLVGSIKPLSETLEGAEATVQRNIETFGRMGRTAKSVFTTIDEAMRSFSFGRDMVPPGRVGLGGQPTTTYYPGYGPTGRRISDVYTGFPSNIQDIIERDLRGGADTPEGRQYRQFLKSFFAGKDEGLELPVGAGGAIMGGGISKGQFVEEQTGRIQQLEGELKQQQESYSQAIRAEMRRIKSEPGFIDYSRSPYGWERRRGKQRLRGQAAARLGVKRRFDIAGLTKEIRQAKQDFINITGLTFETYQRVLALVERTQVPLWQISPNVAQRLGMDIPWGVGGFRGGGMFGGPWGGPGAANPLAMFAQGGIPFTPSWGHPSMLGAFADVFGAGQPLRGFIDIPAIGGGFGTVSAEEYRQQASLGGTVYAIPKETATGEIEYEPSALRTPRSRGEQDILNKLYGEESVRQLYGAGGILTEPVFGIGLESRTRYMFGEAGPEEFRPVGTDAARTVRELHVHFDQIIIRGEADLERIKRLIRDVVKEDNEKRAIF